MERGSKSSPPLLVGAASSSSQTPVGSRKINDRTCCNLCHIKLGAAFLGFVEAIIAVSVLIGALGHVIYKNQNSSVCRNNIFRDCLIFQFNHFNITVIFDYAVILMMIFILLSVLCLFCGVFTDTSCLILPHIVIQAVFLLFSLGYFILYAWSYFYDDLIVKQRKFKFQSMFERMWLATLLLILAGLQSYLFSSVIRCSLYLADIEEKRRRRESAFERCSERVRIAKENGLWRTTSWGGGFQQYKGQYDKPKKEVKNKGFHVQWNTDVEAAKGAIPRQKNGIELTSVEVVKEAPSALSPIPENPEIKPIPKSKIKRNSSTFEDRRSSTTSSASHRVQQPPSQQPIPMNHRGSSESPKKDGVKHQPRSVKKTASEGAGRGDEEGKTMMIITHHGHHKDQFGHVDSPMQTRHASVRSRHDGSKESRSSQKRPKMAKMRSVDSEEFDEVVAFYKDKHHRRRSSDHGGHHQRSDKKSSHSPDKKEIPIVKKVSITASSNQAPYL